MLENIFGSEKLGQMCPAPKGWPRDVGQGLLQSTKAWPEDCCKGTVPEQAHLAQKLNRHAQAKPNLLFLVFVRNGPFKHHTHHLPTPTSSAKMHLPNVGMLVRALWADAFEPKCLPKDVARNLARRLHKKVGPEMLHKTRPRDLARDEGSLHGSLAGGLLHKKVGRCWGIVLAQRNLAKRALHKKVGQEMLHKVCCRAHKLGQKIAAQKGWPRDVAQDSAQRSGEG
jgi:hypothetical protein